MRSMLWARRCREAFCSVNPRLASAEDSRSSHIAAGNPVAAVNANVHLQRQTDDQPADILASGDRLHGGCHIRQLAALERTERAGEHAPHVAQRQANGAPPGVQPEQALIAR